MDPISLPKIIKLDHSWRNWQAWHWPHVQANYIPHMHVDHLLGEKLLSALNFSNSILLLVKAYAASGRGCSCRRWTACATRYQNIYTVQVKSWCWMTARSWWPPWTAPKWAAQWCLKEAHPSLSWCEERSCICRRLMVYGTKSGKWKRMLTSSCTAFVSDVIWKREGPVTSSGLSWTISYCVCLSQWFTMYLKTWRTCQHRSCQNHEDLECFYHISSSPCSRFNLSILLWQVRCLILGTNFVALSWIFSKV